MTDDKPTKDGHRETETSEAFAIVTDELTKEYGRTTAVDGLNLGIEYGTVYGLLGPNGAGKTTTLRMLTSLTPPTSGTARVAGAPITDRKAIVKRIGYLSESPPIHEELTAREQLEYHGGLCDMEPATLQERLETLLDRFELTSDADSRIVTYSKGMRQKTGLIQAILHNPAVLFLDEPTGGLDPRVAHTVRETIVELAASGTTVVLSTHNLSVVEETASKVGILHDGTLVAEGSPSELERRVATGETGTLEDVFLDVTTDNSRE